MKADSQVDIDEIDSIIKEFHTSNLTASINIQKAMIRNETMLGTKRTHIEREIVFLSYLVDCIREFPKSTLLDEGVDES